MSRLPNLSIFLLSACLTLVSTPALADGSEAEQFIQGRHGHLITLLQQPKNAGREQRVSASIDEVFDYRQVATRSLGDEWKNRTEAERSEFQELLTQLVRQTYRKAIDQTVGYNVEYRGTRKSGDDIVVTTVAKHKTDNRKPSTSVDYVLSQVEGKWRAVDIVIDGSSLTETHRRQFTRVIKKDGFSGLIAKMKRKRDKGSD